MCVGGVTFGYLWRSRGRVGGFGGGIGSHLPSEGGSTRSLMLKGYCLLGIVGDPERVLSARFCHISKSRGNKITKKFKRCLDFLTAYRDTTS